MFAAFGCSKELKKVSEVLQTLQYQNLQQTVFPFFFWCNLHLMGAALHGVDHISNLRQATRAMSCILTSPWSQGFSAHKYLNIFTHICMGWFFCFQFHDEWLLHSGSFSNKIFPSVKFLQATNFLSGSMQF